MCRARPSRHLHQRRTVTGILQICWAREEMKLKDLRVFTGIHRCSPYRFGGTWCSPCKPCASLCSIQEYRNSDRREERNAAHCNRLGRLQESKGFKFCRCSKSIQFGMSTRVTSVSFDLSSKESSKYSKWRIRGAQSRQTQPGPPQPRPAEQRPASEPG